VSPLTHGLNFCSACDAGVCLYMSLPLYVCLCVCLSVPVDWLSLVVHMPFMVLYSDIRQGLFYSVLLCLSMCLCVCLCVSDRGGSPTAVRPSDPALCGSCPLVTPYYCRLGDLLCYFVYIVLCVHYCLSVFSCFRCFLCIL